MLLTAVRVGVAAVALGLAFGAGVLVGAGDPPPGAPLEDVADALAADALVPVDRGDLERAAVEGMLRAAGDPWGGVARAGRGAEREALAAVPTSTQVRVVHEGAVPRVVLPAFAPGTADAVERAVRDLGPAGALLDLRGNPGGELDEAVATAGLFLDGGRVASFSRRGEEPQPLHAPPGGQTTAPLVVLVDAATASAAEVVAAALQDRGRAVLVGERTYGKGTVQEPRRVAADRTLNLTVARWSTPAGRVVEGTGLVPDVEVPAAAAVGKGLQVLDGLGERR